jgi:MFS family permease
MNFGKHQNLKLKYKLNYKIKKMVKKNTSGNEKLKAQARRHSIKEGMFATMQASFGGHYISPFAIAINTSSSLVAMLGSISGLLGPMSQLFSSRLIEKYPRKKIILKAVLLETLMWIPLILVAFLFMNNIITNLLPLILLLSFALHIIFANIAGPAWFSWMGDIIDEHKRGAYFSKRNLLTGFVSIVLAISASFFLDFFKTLNWTMAGFIVLFTLAFIGRLTSWKIFQGQYEPKIKLKKGYYFSFTEFLINAPKNNFGKFAIFRACLGFASAISGPLLAVYLLRNLQFSYKTYMIIIFAGTIFSLLVIELWGKFADKYGNYKVLALTSIFIPLIPLAWILSSNIIYLFFVPSIIGGMSWAGFNLAATNFIYDNVSSDKRGLAVSYYNMLVGIGVFLGAGTGALLIKFLNTTVIEPIVLIFLIGTVARMLVAFFGITKIKEIRQTKKLSKNTFKHLILKEAKPTLVEEAHQIMSIKDYLTE